MPASAPFQFPATAQQHLLDECGIERSLLHPGRSGLGHDHRSDLRLDLRSGLLARECDLGHRVLLDIFGLVTGLLDDLLGLGAGFGDDLRRLVLSLPDQTVGFGTAFLQPLVVELFGQLLKFVFHSVI